MDSTAMAAAIERIFEHPLGASGVIFEDETAKGRKAVRPGDVSWFDPADWNPSSVASIFGNTVRLVLIDALRPGTGALTRMLSAIDAAGLRPVVVAPTREFAAALARRGWKRRSCGFGFEHEEVWRSPRLTPSPLPPK